MKKFVSFFLALMMLCSLAACNGLSLKPSDEPESKFGYVGDTMSTEWFDFTVKEAWACTEYDGYTAQEGYKLVVAEMVLKNTWDASVDMWDTDFLIFWEDPDAEGGYDIDITLPVYSEDQFPEEYTLGINVQKTGMLVYEVPEKFRDFSIVFQEVFEDVNDPTNEDGIDGDMFYVSFTAELE